MPKKNKPRTIVPAVREAGRLRDELRAVEAAAIQLCWQIEKSGASPELTECSVMASALHARIRALLE